MRFFNRNLEHKNRSVIKRGREHAQGRAVDVDPWADYCRVFGGFNFTRHLRWTPLGRYNNCDFQAIIFKSAVSPAKTGLIYIFYVSNAFGSVNRYIASKARHLAEDTSNSARWPSSEAMFRLRSAFGD